MADVLANKIKIYLDLYIQYLNNPNKKLDQNVTRAGDDLVVDLKYLYELKLKGRDQYNTILQNTNEIIGKNIYISNGDKITKPVFLTLAETTNPLNLVYPVLEYKTYEQNTPRLYLNFNFKNQQADNHTTLTSAIEYPPLQPQTSGLIQYGGKKNKSKKNKRVKRGRTRRHRKHKMRK